MLRVRAAIAPSRRCRCYIRRPSCCLAAEIITSSVYTACTHSTAAAAKKKAQWAGVKREKIYLNISAFLVA